MSLVLKFLYDNLATCLVLLLLLAIVGVIIFFYVRKKKRGGTSCSSGCSDCPLSGRCHGACDKHTK